MHVLAKLGYIWKYLVKEKGKFSFENAFVEKSESSTWYKWLSWRIVLYNQFECSPSCICLITYMPYIQNLAHASPLYKTHHMRFPHTKFTAYLPLFQNAWHTCPWYKTYHIHIHHTTFTTYTSLLENLPHLCPTYTTYRITVPHTECTAYVSPIQNLPQTHP